MAAGYRHLALIEQAAGNLPGAVGVATLSLDLEWQRERSDGLAHSLLLVGDLHHRSGNLADGCAAWLELTASAELLASLPDSRTVKRLIDGSCGEARTPH